MELIENDRAGFGSNFKKLERNAENEIEFAHAVCVQTNDNVNWFNHVLYQFVNILAFSLADAMRVVLRSIQQTP